MLVNRAATVVLSIAITALLCMGITKLSIESDYRIFFSEDNPQLNTFNELQETYTKSDNLLIMLLPKSGEVFTQETLLAIYQLTELSWQIPYSRRVDSLTNFQHTYAVEDELIVEDLVSQPLGNTTEELAAIANIAVNEPELIGRLISSDMSAAAVNVTLELPLIEPLKEPKEVIAASNTMLAALRASHPEIDFHISGVIPLNDAFSSHALNDLKMLLPLMLLVIALCLWLLLRSFWLVTTTIALVLLSITSALGLSGWLGLNINSVSIMAPTIIITVAVADAVHLLVGMKQFMAKGMGKYEAIQESLRINFWPICLTSITTAIGFFALNFSDSPPFQELGTIVAFGALIAFFLSVTLLPVIVSAVSAGPAAAMHGFNVPMNTLAEFVIRNYKLLLGSLLALVVLAAFQTRTIELSDVLIDYFDETTEIRHDSDRIVEKLTGVYSHNYSFTAPANKKVTDPEFLRQLDAFDSWLQQQPEVMHVSLITQTLKRLNQNLHQDRADYYRLPESSDQAAQYLLLYELSLPYGIDLTNHVDLDKTSAKVGVNIDTLSSREINAFEKRSQLWLNENTPLLNSVGAGPATMFAQISKRNVASMLRGTLVALVLVSLLLIVALKSFKLGLISMIPNIAPALVGFGVWAILYGVVGLATSVVAAVTLGIVVDDSIHFLSKYQRARSEENLSPQDAIRYAFDTVGVALVVNTVVLVLGFLVLTFSHFALNAEMGLLTAITIAAALLLDFLLLPPLLLLIDRPASQSQ